MHSHSPSCKKYPIAKLKIFMFVAAGTAKAGSDVVLMVTFEPEIRLGIFDIVAMNQGFRNYPNVRLILLNESRPRGFRIQFQAASRVRTVKSSARVFLAVVGLV